MDEVKRTRWSWIAVVLLALVAHALGLGGTWHYDDVHTIVQNANLDDPRSLGQFFKEPGLTSSTAASGMYRPVLFVSFLLNRVSTGREPWGFLLTNWLLHAAAAALAFGLARDLVLRSGGDPTRARRIATVVGCCFAVHPVLVETVNYVSARSSGLATTLVLASVWAAVRATAGTRMRWDLAVGSWIAAGAACLTKEIGVMTPLLFGACAVFACGVRRPQRARIVFLAVGLFAVVGIWFWVRGLVLGGGGVPKLGSGGNGGSDAFRGGGRSPWINLMTQVTVVTRYLGLMVWPAELSIDHEARIVTRWSDEGFLGCTALLVTLSVLALRAPRRRPLAAAGWLWFAFALAPTSSILPLNVLMNEHRLYLPAFGLFLWFGSASVTWLERLEAKEAGVRVRRRAVLVAATVLVFAFGIRGMTRQVEWWSAERIWFSATEVSPNSPIAHIGLGNELAARGAWEDAGRAFERAAEIDPRSDAARINAAEIHLRRWEQDRDREGLERAREHLLVVSERSANNNLIALKTARMYRLCYLADGREEDRRGFEQQVHSILSREPGHSAARQALESFARDLEAVDVIPQ